MTDTVKAKYNALSTGKKSLVNACILKADKSTKKDIEKAILGYAYSVYEVNRDVISDSTDLYRAMCQTATRETNGAAYALIVDVLETVDQDTLYDKVAKYFGDIWEGL